MNTKKIIAFLCITAILFSTAGLPVAVSAAQSADDYFIINDQFGANDLNGWAAKVFDGKTSTNTAITEEITGDPGNYMLTYTTTNANNSYYGYLSKAITPVTFSNNTDVVIKVRMKQTGTGRSFLKYNLDGTSYSENEWQHNWGTLVQNDTGKVTVMNGWVRPASGIYSYPKGFGVSDAPGDNLNIITDAANKWYTYKVILHGGETKDDVTADYYIYDANGEQLEKLEGLAIDFPDNSNWANVMAAGATNANWVEGVLNSVDFRLRNAETINIDYVQVWQEGVEITDVETAVNMNSVKVKFSSNVSYVNDLSDYVELYNADGTQIIESTKSFDAATKTVTITPASPLTMGEYYKVKADSEAIEANLKYTYSAQTEFTIQAPACVAENLWIDGVLAPNTKLTANFDLLPENATENGSVIKWFKVSDDSFTEIGTGRELDVTDDYVDSSITFSVIPKAIVDGEEKTGDEAWCESYKTPLSVPVADNLTYDKASAMLDTSISAVYDYSDADGDAESGSEIIWYKESAVDSSDYVEIGRGKSINVTNDLDGYYLKYTVVPKNGAIFRNEGAIKESTSIGPVADMLTASNLFVNSGLEEGVIDPWFATSANGYKGVELTAADAYSGSYSLRAHPRPTQNPGFGQNVTLKAGKTYIISAMVKSASALSHAGYEGYVVGAGNVERPYRNDEFTDINPDEWVRVTLTHTADTNGVYRAGFKSDVDITADAYIDDFYIGELIIKDIETNELAPVTIPETGEEYIEITKGRIINQIDTTNGLTGEKPVLTVSDGEGVYTDGNQLIVTNKAVAGNVTVKVACTPSDKIPGVVPFEKYVTVTLLPNSNTQPQVTDVKISGIVKTGETLSLLYNYYQVEGKADVSAYQWVYAESANGAYQNIEGATGRSFTVTSQYADKFIKCMVTPAADGGKTGTPISSNVLVKNEKPVASDVTVSGQWYIGGKVAGAYVYSDINEDEENGSTYRWLIADTEDGVYTDIEGQTSNELILTSAMQDKYIKFAVTPANSGEFGDKGEEVISQPHLGPVKPQAKDIKITQNGSVYIASYTYYHPHNLKQSGSTYGWYIGDSLVQSGAAYYADFTGTKTLTFKVVPSCENAPNVGDAVSYTITITGSGSSSSTGFGGSVGGFVGGGSLSGGASGGGNSGFQSGVTNINNMDYAVPVEKVPEEVKTASDIDSHWGKTYIDDMVSRGVMSANADGNYEPDSIIARKDMITFLFKALKLEKAEYSAEFSDVSAEDEFAGYLQTMLDNGTIAVDESFRPGDSITREEMCKILYVSLENAGKLEKVEKNKIEAFSDYESVSNWANDYVNTIYSYGIMIGVSEDKFAPQESVTKAQVATMLVRLLAITEEVE